jgi:hypothetical protein
VKRIALVITSTALALAIGAAVASAALARPASTSPAASPLEIPTAVPLRVLALIDLPVRERVDSGVSRVEARAFRVYERDPKVRFDTPIESERGLELDAFAALCRAVSAAWYGGNPWTVLAQMLPYPDELTLFREAESIISGWINYAEGTPNWRSTLAQILATLQIAVGC